MNKLTAIVLIGLISIALSAPIDKDEITQLSKLKPCKDHQAGSRVKHPGNEHKFLRCVSRDSFWIETCPDNLFYNAELDLCDWSVITRTTTEGPDVVVKFRPVLFRHNKTVVTHHRPRRPLDLSRVSVKVTPDTQLFPGQEDIVDTLTPVRTSNNRLDSKTFSSRRPSKIHSFGNSGSSFTHFNKNEDKIVDPSEFTALPSKKMTKKEEEEVKSMETTTERPMRVRTTTERPVVRTTTEKPMRVRTTTERPVFRSTTERSIEVVRRPVEVVRPSEKFVEDDEEVEEPRKHFQVLEKHDDVDEDFITHEDDDHNDDEELVEVDDHSDKPVLIRHGNIVKVTEPKKFIETRRRPISVVREEHEEHFDHDNHRDDDDDDEEEEVFVRQPFRTEEIVEEVPVHEKNEKHHDRHRSHHHHKTHRPVEEVDIVPVQTHRRRPVEKVEVAPLEEEKFEFTTSRTPLFTSTRRTFASRVHTIPSRTQLFKQLAEEIPGARVVSFNGQPINNRF